MQEQNKIFDCIPIPPTLIHLDGHHWPISWLLSIYWHSRAWAHCGNFSLINTSKAASFGHKQSKIFNFIPILATLALLLGCNWIWCWVLAIFGPSKGPLHKFLHFIQNERQYYESILLHNLLFLVKTANYSPFCWLQMLQMPIFGNTSFGLLGPTVGIYHFIRKTRYFLSKHFDHYSGNLTKNTESDDL